MARQNLCFAIFDSFFKLTWAVCCCFRPWSVTDHLRLLCNQLVLKLNPVPEGRFIHFLFFITHHTTDNFLRGLKSLQLCRNKRKEKNWGTFKSIALIKWQTQRWYCNPIKDKEKSEYLSFSLLDFYFIELFSSLHSFPDWTEKNVRLHNCHLWKP